MSRSLQAAAPARSEPPKVNWDFKVPRPVTTVSGKGHTPGKTLEEMSYDEYAKVRRAQEKAKER